MLKLLGEGASDRKLRLFACACSGRFLYLHPDRRIDEAFGVAERFADGLVSDAARANAQRTTGAPEVIARAKSPKWEHKWEHLIASLVHRTLAREAFEAAWNAPVLSYEVLDCLADGHRDRDTRAIHTAEWQVCNGFLRDIFGNPFRPGPAIDRAWMTWNAGTVPKVAAAIYDSRDFGRFVVLADALEDAGCTDAEILGHLRGPGPHVRGCWAVDVLSGKK
jgi:hypothetical protein